MYESQSKSEFRQATKNEKKRGIWIEQNLFKKWCYNLFFNIIFKGIKAFFVVLKQFSDSGSIEMISKLLRQSCTTTMTSSQVENCLPPKNQCRLGKGWRSDAMRSGERTGCPKLSHRKSLRTSCINLVVCGLALSWMNRDHLRQFATSVHFYCLLHMDEHIEVGSWFTV